MAVSGCDMINPPDNLTLVALLRGENPGDHSQKNAQIIVVRSFWWGLFSVAIDDDALFDPQLNVDGASPEVRF